MNRLEAAFKARLDEDGKILVPYLTAGLPTPQSFIDLLSSLEGIADAVEVGIPYSDPIMDGPVIQAASTKALENGVTVEGSLRLIREARRYVKVPIAIMTYYNPVHRMGAEKFVSTASESDVSGLIVPDLPYEEAGELIRYSKKADVCHIQMVAPTTSQERAQVLAKASTGFVYAVSRLGVTGEQTTLESRASEVVDRIRPHTKVPVLLGIGISDADQAAMACKSADGVIVGSALMRRVLQDDVHGVVELLAKIRKAI